MNETERIKQHYEERKSSDAVGKVSSYTQYIQQVISERESVYAQVVRSKFKDFSHLQFLEMGAGEGANLSLFKSLGIKEENIYGNELQEDRAAQLKSNHPNIHTLPGDALELDFVNKFDIVFQSTVFTSILDSAFKKKLADKLWEMTKPGGIILWYDFTFDNPNNQSVKGIKKNEIKTLFSSSDKIEFKKVTLAPPIGRRFQNFYGFLNAFPFLRTHIVAVIHK